MTSFIVVTQDDSVRKIYIQNFCETRNIAIFDRTVLSRDSTIKQNTQSIGIEDIKLMQKKIFLKPIKSDLKAIIIDEAHLLTTEAQNALLKILEEPPAKTILILSTQTKETLLPTIISRCTIVELQNERKKLSEAEKQELELFLEEFSQWGIGERLKKAEILAKDKEKALVWIEKVILVAREQLLQTYASNENNRAMEQGNNQILKSFQTLHTRLKTTNINPRFAIENTLLTL